MIQSINISKKYGKAEVLTQLGYFYLKKPIF